MLWKCCTQYVSKFGKLSRGHGTGKCQFSFQSQRTAMPKNVQTTAQLHSSQFSSGMSDSLQPHGLQHPRLPCPSPAPEACSNSSPLSRWCHPTISSSVNSFSSCLQSFPASGSFLMSWFFASGGQSTGASASTSVLPMNSQDWFPLGLTGLIFLQSKGLLRVFSNTTVQKHQFFSAELSLWFNSPLVNHKSIFYVYESVSVLKMLACAIV